MRPWLASSPSNSMVKEASSASGRLLETNVPVPWSLRTMYLVRDVRIETAACSPFSAGSSQRSASRPVSCEVMENPSIMGEFGPSMTQAWLRRRVACAAGANRTAGVLSNHAVHESMLGAAFIAEVAARARAMAAVISHEKSPAVRAYRVVRYRYDARSNHYQYYDCAPKGDSFPRREGCEKDRRSPCLSSPCRRSRS